MSAVQMGATGKRLDYDGHRWIRQDLYHGVGESLCYERSLVQKQKKHIEFLQTLLVENNINHKEIWKVIE